MLVFGKREDMKKGASLSFFLAEKFVRIVVWFYFLIARW